MADEDEVIGGRRAVLLVVDMQNDFCHAGGAVAARNGDVSLVQAMAPRLRALLALARQANVPIIHIRTHHSPWTNSPTWVTRHHGRRVVQCFPGTWGADFYAGFEPLVDERWDPERHEYVVTKHRYSGFVDTDLDLILRSQSIDTLIVTGTTTNTCVESTARDGFMKDYAIVVVADCTAAGSVGLHEASLEDVRQSFGTVMTADDLVAVWRRAGRLVGIPSSGPSEPVTVQPSGGTPSFRKEILLEDERGRGFPAVVRYGPYLFVSGSDGHRDPKTERIVPDLAWQTVEQCRNSYGRVQRRLEQCGYGGSCAVRIQNFTSGQEWRLQRMALWPEYFGAAEHGLAVSFGAQARMSGINMITTVVMGVTPEVERVAVVPQPTPGRAARVVRAGPFVYVIGVAGRTHPETNDPAPEEVPEAFAVQLGYACDWLRAHAARASVDLRDFVRMDACIRDVNRVSDYGELVCQYLGGAIPFASSVVGVPLGGRAEQEIGGIATAPGVAREIRWFDDRPGRAQAVIAGQLVFASACSGLEEAKSGRILRELHGDPVGQGRQALRRLEAALARCGVGLDRLLRLDVFLRDIYFEDEFLRVARDIVGGEGPAITIIGAELANGAEVELTAIAGT